jgi:hypothetical protein
MNRLAAVLPDFSWRNIPKLGKIYQKTKNIQNDHRICQMLIKNTK